MIRGLAIADGRKSFRAELIVATKAPQPTGDNETAAHSTCDEPAVTMQRLIENVSHDLRGPLAVAKEFTSIMLDGLAGEVPARQHEYLEVVAESLDELEAMVGDLIDAGRFDAALVGVFRRPCSASEILSPLRAKLARKAAVHHIELEVSEAENLPNLFCDPDHVGRVLTRLVTHAIRSADPNGSVGLQVRRADNDDASVVFEVKDDGSGLPTEKLRLIQERLRSDDDGTGAGLADLDLRLTAVKQLVALNLGEIIVSSGPGRGTAFKVSLPVAEPFNLVQRFLSYSAVLRRGASYASMHIIRVDEPADPQTVAEIGSFLQHHVRCSDMVFPLERGAWFVLLPSNRKDASAMLRRLQSAWSECNANRPQRPLPRIAVETRGCWRVERDGGELLVELHRVLHGRQIPAR